MQHGRIKHMRRRQRRLLRYLSGGQVVKGDLLAVVFGIGIRTVYRDIDALRAKGHNIAASAGVGFQLRKGKTG